MRPRKRATPQVERLEGKALLSAAPVGPVHMHATPQVARLESKVSHPSDFVPVLTRHIYGQTLLQIQHYGNGFAQDHSKSNLSSNLALIVPVIPFGKRQLLPVWQKDVNIFNPKIKGSAFFMIGKIKIDFVDFVRKGVASGEFVFH